MALEEERAARMDSEDVAARLREQLAQVREQQDTRARTLQAELDQLSARLQSAKARAPGLASSAML